MGEYIDYLLIGIVCLILLAGGYGAYYYVAHDCYSKCLDSQNLCYKQECHRTGGKVSSKTCRDVPADCSDPAILGNKTMCLKEEIACKK